MNPVTITERPSVASFPPGATLGPRTLDDFELVWVIAGSATWTWLESGEERQLEPGLLMLERPGMTDHFRWAENATTLHGYVHFDLDDRDALGTCPLLRPVVAPGPIAGLLDYLLWLAEEPVRDWLQHAERTLEFLLQLFASAPLPDPPTRPEHPAVVAALDHVRDVWERQMRPLTTTELAAAASVSKEHLARLFRGHYGVGIITSLELIRLDRAETLLVRSNLRVSQVADTCGFQDALYFSKRFRSVYGASPRQYRERGIRHAPLLTGRIPQLASRLTPSKAGV